MGPQGAGKEGGRGPLDSSPTFHSKVTPPKPSAAMCYVERKVTQLTSMMFQKLTRLEQLCTVSILACDGKRHFEIIIIIYYSFTMLGGSIQIYIAKKLKASCNEIKSMQSKALAVAE
jgi:hypothetical protein